MASKKDTKSSPLREKWLEPPFSVLDTRKGEWGFRKKVWKASGLQSELGRDGGMTYNINPFDYKPDMKNTGNTSIFDPVLTELILRWFSASDSQVLDPFAGGSVRGVASAALGRHYTGIELSGDQVRANRAQHPRVTNKARDLLGIDTPIGSAKWLIGDSDKKLESLPEDYTADLIMSCPPYADLEVYSDDPRDISNMKYEDFLTVYRSIITKSAERLNDDRFAAFVVSEVRNKKTGEYRGLVPDTVAAFRDAGLSFYNDAVLLNMIGSAALRANGQMKATRKLQRLHQNVLVFVKGDAKRAADYCGDVVSGFLSPEDLKAALA
jgi:DNA modification methylase